MPARRRRAFRQRAPSPLSPDGQTPSRRADLRHATSRYFRSVTDFTLSYGSGQRRRHFIDGVTASLTTITFTPIYAPAMSARVITNIHYVAQPLPPIGLNVRLAIFLASCQLDVVARAPFLADGHGDYGRSTSIRCDMRHPARASASPPVHDTPDKAIHIQRAR